MPQGAVHAKLVQISPINLGLMNGGYIDLVFMGIINQQTSHLGVPPCRWLCLVNRLAHSICVGSHFYREIAILGYTAFSDRQYGKAVANDMAFAWK